VRPRPQAPREGSGHLRASPVHLRLPCVRRLVPCGAGTRLLLALWCGVRIATPSGTPRTSPSRPQRPGVGGVSGVYARFAI
jgi:hypothetical protein